MSSTILVYPPVYSKAKPVEFPLLPTKNKGTSDQEGKEEETGIWQNEGMDFFDSWMYMMHESMRGKNRG